MENIDLKEKLKKRFEVTETDFEEREITAVRSDGKLGKEKVTAKEYKIPIENMNGSISVILKKKDKYTGVRINDKEVMIYVGENKSGNRWITEINNEVKSHTSRADAEDYTGKKIIEIIKRLAEKANHIYRMAKMNIYVDGTVIKKEYGDLCISKVEKIDKSWNVHVLGRSVWLYDTREKALTEARKYFLRYYIEREFIESPWGNYMGNYREIIEQYTQKIIDKERFVDEKKSLWAKGGNVETRGLLDEFMKSDDRKTVMLIGAACICIGKHYLSEMFEKNYPKIRAVSMLSSIKEVLGSEEDKRRMELFIKHFEEIKKKIRVRGEDNG